MIPDAGIRRDAGWRDFWPLAAIAAAATLVGIYARFKGLGTWSFGPDEFYISRSIDNVLRSGLPEYLCGGYYTRGLVYQYAVAGLRLAELSPEFAGRLVSAVSSLAVLPAVYLLGTRVHGRSVGLLAVTILALSVWEVEMARFARMYAPFQAVFVWYLLFFLKYTVDRERWALLGMIALSVLGILVWEGGALLGLANLLPPFINHDNGRLKRCDWLYVGAMALLLALFLFVLGMDLRGFAEDPVAAAGAFGDAAADGGAAVGGDDAGGYPLWMTLGRPVGWAVLALVPLGFALTSLRWLWSLRSRWLTAGGLAAALFLALAHQFLACGAALALMLLTGLVGRRELLGRPARWFAAAIGASAVFWIAFGLLTDTWYGAAPAGGPAAVDRLVALTWELGGFPNILDEVVRPWGRTIPVLSVALFIALAALALRSVVREPVRVTAVGALLVLVLIMVLAIGGAGSPRIETRYSFFLYPLMVTLALAAVAFACDRFFERGPRAMLATALAGLLLFAATEDFQPRHIANIDSRVVNFGIGLSPEFAAHYYPRGDVGGWGRWRAVDGGPEDLVISGVPHVEHEYRDIV
jgi:hypothetical protein